jgi:hypothetical protein
MKPEIKCPCCGLAEPYIAWISGEFVAECCERLSSLAEDILPDEMLGISNSANEAKAVWRTLAACAVTE